MTENKKKGLVAFVSLPHLIQMLRDASNAPAAEWPSFARGIDPLARVATSEAGACASILASSARALLLQLDRLDRETHPSMRMAMLAMSDVLQAELNARGTNQSQPYYTRDNG